MKNLTTRFVFSGISTPSILLYFKGLIDEKHGVSDAGQKNLHSKVGKKMADETLKLNRAIEPTIQNARTIMASLNKAVYDAQFGNANLARAVSTVSGYSFSLQDENSRVIAKEEVSALRRAKVRSKAEKKINAYLKGVKRVRQTGDCKITEIGETKAEQIQHKQLEIFHYAVDDAIAKANVSPNQGVCPGSTEASTSSTKEVN